MTEFINLGKHCSVHSCQQLDFLPFTCPRCLKVYCQDHRQFEKHQCSVTIDKTVPVCPLCNQIIPVFRNKGEDPNEKVDKHIRDGCPKVNYQEDIKTFKCSFHGCKEVEVQKIECKLCHHIFCFKHRLNLIFNFNLIL